jgi:hypothetical protein
VRITPSRDSSVVLVLLGLGIFAGCSSSDKGSGDSNQQTAGESGENQGGGSSQAGASARDGAGGERAGGSGIGGLSRGGAGNGGTGTGGVSRGGSASGGTGTGGVSRGGSASGGTGTGGVSRGGSGHGGSSEGGWSEGGGGSGGNDAGTAGTSGAGQGGTEGGDGNAGSPNAGAYQGGAGASGGTSDAGGSSDGGVGDPGGGSAGVAEAGTSGAAGAAGATACPLGEGRRLVPVRAAISALQNCFEIQGTWSSTPESQVTVTEDNAKYCVTGTLSAGGADVVLSLPLSDGQPYRASGRDLGGFQLALEGTLPDLLRLQVVSGTEPIAYCEEFSATASVLLLFTEAHPECWLGESTATPDLTALSVLEVVIPASQGELSFDFCITELLASPEDCATLVPYYRDADYDGYGDPNSAVSACMAPEGYVDNPDDCYDGNDVANPDYTGPGSPEDRGDGSFDYDCDGLETPVIGGGTCGPECSNPTETGFVGDIPPCGESGLVLTGCSSSGIVCQLHADGTLGYQRCY